MNNNVIKFKKKMVNNKFRCYGYKENTEFVGIKPKLMNELGEDLTIGQVDEPVISIFDPTAKGYDSMKDVDVEGLANTEE